MCHEQGEYSSAKAHCELAWDLCPTFPPVWNNKGLAHFRMGDLEFAKQCYFNAVQVAELEPQATSEMDRQRVKLLKRFPRETISFALPGTEAMLRGDHAKAIQWFREARKTAPEVVEFIDPIAECLCHLGRFADAETSAREVVKRDATYASAWVNLSWAIGGQGDFDSCQTAAKRALTLEGYPDAQDAALSNSVRALCEMGAFSDALKMINDYASKHPKSQRPTALRTYVASRMQGGR